MVWVRKGGNQMLQIPPPLPPINTEWTAECQNPLLQPRLYRVGGKMKWKATHTSILIDTKKHCDRSMYGLNSTISKKTKKWCPKK